MLVTSELTPLRFRVARADPADVAQDRGQHQLPGPAHAGRPPGALGRHPLVAQGRALQHLLLPRPDAGVGHPGLDSQPGTRGRSAIRWWLMGGPYNICSSRAQMLAWGTLG